MSPLIALLIDEFSYFGTMVITGALLLNNDVGGALYRTPPATISICQETSVTQEPAAETGTDLSQNVISAIILHRVILLSQESSDRKRNEGSVRVFPLMMLIKTPCHGFTCSLMYSWRRICDYCLLLSYLIYTVFRKKHPLCVFFYQFAQKFQRL